MRYSKGWGAVLIIILLLLLDQVLKIWIKTHMQLHESIEITPWFYLYFTENPGMAFGIEVIGKLFLSVFRIVAVLFIGYYLYKLVKENYKFGFIACISLVFAGAVGNIIDSIFYGVIFDHSFGQLATFMPEGGGYASWLHAPRANSPSKFSSAMYIQFFEDIGSFTFEKKLQRFNFSSFCLSPFLL